MAVIVTTVKRLLGTTAEMAAMTDAQRNATPAGSTFFDTDTGLLYALNNATPREWGLKRGNVQLTGSIAAADEQLTVTDAVQILTVATYGDATKALVTVEGADIRFRLTGDDPSATVGHLLKDGESVVLTSADDIANFKAFRDDTDDATIYVTYS